MEGPKEGQSLETSLASVLEMPRRVVWDVQAGSVCFACGSAVNAAEV